jgi:hypothetical protein
MYIITRFYELENQKDYEITIEPPACMAVFLAAAESVSYARYQIEYVEHHEIVCPRYTFAGGAHVTVIPWFLIPGRPYPIQVYLYACALYSANPEIGQRGAAKATREKFRLGKFSHSTVCRSFKSFEEARKQALEKKFGEEFTAFGPVPKNLVGAAAKARVKEGEAKVSERRFPTAAGTLARREAMRPFFPKFPCGAARAAVESASSVFAKGWHEKTRRLLL